MSHIFSLRTLVELRTQKLKNYSSFAYHVYFVWHTILSQQSNNAVPVYLQDVKKVGCCGAAHTQFINVAVIYPFFPKFFSILLTKHIIELLLPANHENVEVHWVDR